MRIAAALKIMQMAKTMPEIRIHKRPSGKIGKI